MNKSTSPRTLPELGKTGRKLYRDLMRQYPDLSDSASQALLMQACKAADLAEEARGEMKKHGMVIVDSKGRPARNPAASVYRDCCGILNTSFRLLGLRHVPDKPARRHRGAYQLEEV